MREIASRDAARRSAVGGRPSITVGGGDAASTGSSSIREALNASDCAGEDDAIVRGERVTDREALGGDVRASDAGERFAVDDARAGEHGGAGDASFCSERWSKAGDDSFRDFGDEDAVTVAITEGDAFTDKALLLPLRGERCSGDRAADENSDKFVGASATKTSSW
jgi:hypothetical protein